MKNKEEVTNNLQRHSLRNIMTCVQPYSSLILILIQFLAKSFNDENINPISLKSGIILDYYTEVET